MGRAVVSGKLIFFFFFFAVKPVNFCSTQQTRQRMWRG